MKRNARTVAAGALILAAIALPLAAVQAIAQTPQAPAPASELRAAFSTPVEVAEGRRVVESSCSKCHGVDGLSSAAGVPHLAGQRAPYLLLEARAYKAGARTNEAMAGAVKFLSDDALFKAAAYYASLDPAAPAAAVAGKGAPARPDPSQAGKAAAAGCAGCHGDIGVSKMAGMPSLAGLDPKYLSVAMSAYKSGERKHDMMKTLLSGVSDADAKNIALFYALQKPAVAQTKASGDAAAGKAAAAACAGCHGEQGVSGTPATPSLAGQEAQYFVTAVQAYKDGARSDATMKGVVASLDERAITNLAAYYATLPPQAPKVAKPLTTAEWAQRCDRCHGVNGNSTDPRTPALAAQRADYLEKVMLAYKNGTRKSPQMAAMAAPLSEDDIAGLATYYARQKPRAVIYVPVSK